MKRTLKRIVNPRRAAAPIQNHRLSVKTPKFFITCRPNLVVPSGACKWIAYGYELLKITLCLLELHHVSLDNMVKRVKSQGERRGELTNLFIHLGANISFTVKALNP